MSDPLRVRWRVPVEPGRRVREAIAAMPDAACAWCGGPTPMRADTPFRPDLGSVPMHLMCGQEMREAYRRWKAAEPIAAELVAGMRRLSAYVKGSE